MQASLLYSLAALHAPTIMHEEKEEEGDQIDQESMKYANG